MLKDTIKQILPDPVLDAARGVVDGAEGFCQVGSVAMGQQVIIGCEIRVLDGVV